jgi:predicted transcriptional regulator
MSTLTELTAQIVSAHAAKNQMTQEEVLQEIQKVYASLKNLESGIPAQEVTEEPQPPQLTIKQAFKKNEVTCLICGKGMKTLARHLNQAHQLKPGAYRKQFGIPSSQPLTAKSYSDSRKQMAIDRNLGEGLAKARKIRMDKIATVSAEKEKKAAPPKAKAPVAGKKKAGTPAKATKK